MRKLILFLIFLFAHTQAFSAQGNVLQRLCNDSRLHCIRVQRGQTWQGLFPNSQFRDTVQRINRMNTGLIPGMRIAVPHDASAHYMQFSPFPIQKSGTGRTVIIFDPKLNAWGAYDEAGRLVNWGPGSSGKAWCPDTRRACRTPAGHFTIFEKRGQGCFSTKYPFPRGGAPMPYCMFFSNGYAFHASNAVPGFNASHGCIRIFYKDAQWMNQSFIGVHHTQVIVLPYGSERIDKQNSFKSNTIKFSDQSYQNDESDQDDDEDDEQ
jgi:L,D-transpeptidase ErfK/SrfK